MKDNDRKLLLIVIFTLIAAIFLAGCGSPRKLSSSVQERKDLDITRWDSTNIALSEFLKKSENIKILEDSEMELNEKDYYPPDSTGKQAVKSERKVKIKNNKKTEENAVTDAGRKKDETKLEGENIKDKGEIKTEIKEKTGPGWLQSALNKILLIIVTIIVVVVCCCINKYVLKK